MQQRKFATLNDLVREYRSPQNGLICGLSNPVGDVNAAPKSSKFGEDGFQPFQLVVICEPVSISCGLCRPTFIVLQFHFLNDF